jgi:hypothetical protein
MQENQIAFPCGLLPFKKDGKWGYLNNKGVVVILPQFEYATDFADCGLASVKINEKRGYININGEFVISPQFKWAFTFKANGLAHVQKDGEIYYIDLQGNQISEGTVDEEMDSDLGLRKYRKDGKTGAVNSKGEIVIPPIFDEVWTQSEGIPILVSIDKKKGYVDLQGNIIIELKYDYENAMPFGSCGLTTIKENDKVGFINQKGEWVLLPQFDFAYFFCEGLCSVILNKKWGYVDSSGKLAIPPQFDNGSNFRGGLAIVSKDKQCGYIDTTGTLVIPPQFTDSYFFQNGLAAVKKGRKCGYIDRFGNVVIPLQFLNVGGFSKDGYAVVRKKEGFGLIDKAGEWIVPPPCDGLLINDFFE